VIETKGAMPCRLVNKTTTRSVQDHVNPKKKEKRRTGPGDPFQRAGPQNSLKGQYRMAKFGVKQEERAATESQQSRGSSFSGGPRSKGGKSVWGENSSPEPLNRFKPANRTRGRPSYWVVHRGRENAGGSQAGGTGGGSTKKKEHGSKPGDGPRASGNEAAFGHRG